MGNDAKYVVRLSVAERLSLEKVLSQARTAQAKVLRARMLLKADVDRPAWGDEQIALTGTPFFKQGWNTTYTTSVSKDRRPLNASLHKRKPRLQEGQHVRWKRGITPLSFLWGGI